MRTTLVRTTGQDDPDTFVCDAEGNGREIDRSPMVSDTYVGNPEDDFSDGDGWLRAAKCQLVAQGWKRPEKLTSMSVEIRARTSAPRLHTSHQDAAGPCIAIETRIVPLWSSTKQQKCGDAASSSPLPSPASVLITSHNGARPAKPQARALLA